MKKKLLLLGGIRYLLPVIESAHKLGIYVITADYLPDNIAHRYSDEYVNVSILDRDIPSPRSPWLNNLTPQSAQSAQSAVKTNNGFTGLNGFFSERLAA